MPLDRVGLQEIPRVLCPVYQIVEQAVDRLPSLGRIMATAETAKCPVCAEPLAKRLAGSDTAQRSHWI